MIQNWIFHTPGGKRLPCCWLKLISKNHCRPLFFFIFPFFFVPRIMMQEKQNPWKGIQKKSISFWPIEVAQPVNQHPGSHGCLHSGRFCWILPDKILKCRCQVKSYFLSRCCLPEEPCINKSCMHLWKMQICVKHVFTICKVVVGQEATLRAS